MEKPVVMRAMNCLILWIFYCVDFREAFHLSEKRRSRITSFLAKNENDFSVSSTSSTEDRLQDNFARSVVLFNRASELDPCPDFLVEQLSGLCSYLDSMGQEISSLTDSSVRPVLNPKIPSFQSMDAYLRFVNEEMDAVEQQLNEYSSFIGSSRIFPKYDPSVYQAEDERETKQSKGFWQSLADRWISASEKVEDGGRRATRNFGNLLQPNQRALPAQSAFETSKSQIMIDKRRTGRLQKKTPRPMPQNIPAAQMSVSSQPYMATQQSQLNRNKASSPPDQRKWRIPKKPSRQSGPEINEQTESVDPPDFRSSETLITKQVSRFTPKPPPSIPPEIKTIVQDELMRDFSQQRRSSSLHETPTTDPIIENESHVDPDVDQGQEISETEAETSATYFHSLSQIPSPGQNEGQNVPPVATNEPDKATSEPDANARRFMNVYWTKDDSSTSIEETTADEATEETVSRIANSSTNSTDLETEIDTRVEVDENAESFMNRYWSTADTSSLETEASLPKSVISFDKTTGALRTSSTTSAMGSEDDHLEGDIVSDSDEPFHLEEKTPEGVEIRGDLTTQEKTDTEVEPQSGMSEYDLALQFMSMNSGLDDPVPPSVPRATPEPTPTSPISSPRGSTSAVATEERPSENGSTNTGGQFSGNGSRSSMSEYDLALQFMSMNSGLDDPVPPSVPRATPEPTPTSPISSPRSSTSAVATEERPSDNDSTNTGGQFSGNGSRSSMSEYDLALQFMSMNSGLDDPVPPSVPRATPEPTPTSPIFEPPSSTSEYDLAMDFMKMNSGLDDRVSPNIQSETSVQSLEAQPVSSSTESFLRANVQSSDSQPVSSDRFLDATILETDYDEPISIPSRESMLSDRVADSSIPEMDPSSQSPDILDSNSNIPTVYDIVSFEGSVSGEAWGGSAGNPYTNGPPPFRPERFAPPGHAPDRPTKPKIPAWLAARRGDLGASSVDTTTRNQSSDDDGYIPSRRELLQEKARLEPQQPETDKSIPVAGQQNVAGYGSQQRRENVAKSPTVNQGRSTGSRRLLDPPPQLRVYNMYDKAFEIFNEISLYRKHEALSKELEGIIARLSFLASASSGTSFGGGLDSDVVQNIQQSENRRGFIQLDPKELDFIQSRLDAACDMVGMPKGIQQPKSQQNQNKSKTQWKKDPNDPDQKTPLLLDPTVPHSKNRKILRDPNPQPVSVSSELRKQAVQRYQSTQKPNENRDPGKRKPDWERDSDDPDQKTPLLLDPSVPRVKNTRILRDPRPQPPSQSSDFTKQAVQRFQKMESSSNESFGNEIQKTEEEPVLPKRRSSFSSGYEFSDRSFDNKSENAGVSNVRPPPSPTSRNRNYSEAVSNVRSPPSQTDGNLNDSEGFSNGGPPPFRTGQKFAPPGTLGPEIEDNPPSQPKRRQSLVSPGSSTTRQAPPNPLYPNFTEDPKFQGSTTVETVQKATPNRVSMPSSERSPTRQRKSPTSRDFSRPEDTSDIPLEPPRPSSPNVRKPNFSDGENSNRLTIRSSEPPKSVDQLFEDQQQDFLFNTNRPRDKRNKSFIPQRQEEQERATRRDRRNAEVDPLMEAQQRALRERQPKNRYREMGNRRSVEEIRNSDSSNFQNTYDGPRTISNRYQETNYARQSGSNDYYYDDAPSTEGANEYYGKENEAIIANEGIEGNRIVFDWGSFLQESSQDTKTDSFSEEEVYMDHDDYYSDEYFDDDQNSYYEASNNFNNDNQWDR